MFRTETSLSCKDDLKTLALDCIGNSYSFLVDRLCEGYAMVVRDTCFVDFYGLRDFMYFLIYLKRHLKHNSHGNEQTNEFILRSLESITSINCVLFVLLDFCFLTAIDIKKEKGH